MNWVFAYGLEDPGSVLGWVIPKTQKKVLEAAILNTHYFKVRIKGKVEKSCECSEHHLAHLSVVASKKGAFESSST